MFFRVCLVAALWRVVCVLVLSSNLQQAQFYTNMDPTLRQILQEKEQTILALQQTVEVSACTHTHTHTNTGNGHKADCSVLMPCREE